MKTIVYSLFLLLMLTLSWSSCYSQWVHVGTPHFDLQNGGFGSLVFNQGTPYIAFKDLQNGYGTTLVKFMDSTWIPVGQRNFSNGKIRRIESLSLAFNAATPYVAFVDEDIGNKLSVMKFDGTKWVYVGSRGFSLSGVDYPDLTIVDGIPYVVFQDLGVGSKTSVMKFDGSNWGFVGNRGISAGISSNHRIAQDHGTIYIAFRDHQIGGGLVRATVMKYDANNWGVVGNPVFSQVGICSYLDLNINQGIPYLVTVESDTTWLHKPTLMKFDGSNWVAIGNRRFSPGSIFNIHLAFDDNNFPYVAFRDSDTLGNAGITVMNFDGVSWSVVGARGFSGRATLGIDIALHENIPYVAYTKFTNGNNAIHAKKLRSWADLSIDTNACYNYTSPSGDTVWFTPGIYSDTVWNDIGRDIAYTIDLNIDDTKLEELNVPNVFTPNGDSKNDFFQINTEGVASSSIKIYNRWGGMVFNSEKIDNGWNGTTLNGQNASNGIYYYTIQLQLDRCGEVYEKKYNGMLSLLH